MNEHQRSARRDLEQERLLTDCTVSFTRRSGPGGQNRNKVETAAILLHKPTGLRAEANERRSQLENREAALFRLQLLLALSTRQIPPDTGPSPLWNARCGGGKIRVNPEHPDFPLLLAEALDVLAANGAEARVAAESLGVSATQLIRFLKDEPRALAWLNTERSQRGLGPLR